MWRGREGRQGREEVKGGRGGREGSGGRVLEQEGRESPIKNGSSNSCKKIDQGVLFM